MTDALGSLRAALSERYRYERELGAGGMATVYLAQDLKHHRPVAIKVLKPGVAAALGNERFLREIEIGAQLHHPHILSLYDSGEAAGFLYYVMPYVKGESLRDRLDRERQLPVEEAIQITREVADALGYAHSQNVVHRDIKPENILLESGHAFVADFGIAWAMSVAGGDRLTQTGLAIGTPAYMSPEQAAAEASLDGRTDTYSLATVLYEMLTGSPPFTGATAQAILARKSVESAPPLRSVRDTVPFPVEHAVLRALARVPADRFATARHFADALLEPDVRRLTQSRSLRWGALAAIVVLTAGLGVRQFIQGAPPRFVAGRAVPVVSSTDELELDASVSPDGKLVAYVIGPRGSRRLAVRQVIGGQIVRVAPDVDGDPMWPRWSPDGTTILFAAGNRLLTVNALGGATTVVAETQEDQITGDWSPLGDALTFATSDTLWTRRLPDQPATPLVIASNIAVPTWSPDGRFIAYSQGNAAYLGGTGNVSPSAIWMISANGGTPWAVTDSTRMNFGAVWAPDSRSILFVSDREGIRDVYQLSLDARGRPSAQPARVTSGLNVQALSLTSDGTRLVYSVHHIRRNVWSVPVFPDRAAGFADARPVTRGNETVEGISVSRDRRWLLFDSNRTGNSDIFMLDLSDSSASREPIQLTRDPADDFQPRFSPDQGEIAFYSLRSGTRDIHVMRADGRNVARVTSEPAMDLYPDWAPDGSSIVFGRALGGAGPASVRITTRAPDGSWSEPREVLVGECAADHFPRWSPDGRWIARPCGGRIALASPDGNLQRSLPVPGERVWYVEWGARSDVIYARMYRSPEIWAVSTASGRARLVFRVTGDRSMPRQEFASDGRYLYVTLASDEADVWMMELAQSR